VTKNRQKGLHRIIKKEAKACLIFQSSNEPEISLIKTLVNQARIVPALSQVDLYLR